MKTAVTTTSRATKQASVKQPGVVISKALFASLPVLLSTASSVDAHPGHETLPIESQSAYHYLLEPVHAVPAVVVGLAVVFIASIVRRYVDRRRCSSR